MKIQLLSAMHGRHKAVSLALESWRKEGLEPVMVVSNTEDARFCDDNNVEWTQADNKPLSSKWQAGVNYLRDFKADYDAYIMLGSDDLIKGSNGYIKYLNEGYEFIGVGDCYIRELDSGLTKHWMGYTNHRKGETAGAGRCLSKSLMNKLNWVLWELPKDNGLDGELYYRINLVGAKCKTVYSNEIKITDLKDENSLTPFSRFNLPIIERD